VDGFAVLNSIRADESTQKIPVLILTAKDLTKEDLKELKCNNVQQLVQKGDVPRETLIHKTRLMLGELTKITPVKKTRAPEILKEKYLKKAPSEGKPTILVVEDSPDNMLTVRAVLHNDYTILEATDGEKGLHMALTERPDLILLDMSLPKMDGYTVVGKVKEDKKTHHIPVIALTARAMKGEREEIIEAGCDDYISKPIEPEEVLQKIREWLEK
jgi:CheY-like chemotaxis protein